MGLEYRRKSILYYIARTRIVQPVYRHSENQISQSARAHAYFGQFTCRYHRTNVHVLWTDSIASFTIETGGQKGHDID